ncbi:MAG: rhomboid family intramembrane serine protease [Nocardioides sp.]
MSTPPAPQPGTPEQGVPVCYRHPDRETHIRCQRCERPICPDCMNPASVGFQCPDCVRDGARSTRQATNAYGGKRSDNPALTSQVLIALNLAVWLLLIATGGGGSHWYYRLVLIPRGADAIIDGARQFVPGVADGAYWQLATSAFTHVSLFHIGFNMMALWVLGPQLELILGRARFLAVYLLSGLAGSAAVYWLSATNTPTLGASGAIFGLMGALVVIAFKVHGSVSAILPWIAFNFVLTFLVPHISWQGHVGGFVGGLVLGALFAYAPKASRSRWQLAGCVVFAVVVLAAIVARTAVLTG